MIRDSRILYVAEGDGVVEFVDANEIVIRYTRTDEEKFVSFDDDIKTIYPSKIQENKPEYLY